MGLTFDAESESTIGLRVSCWPRREATKTRFLVLLTVEFDGVLERLCDGFTTVGMRNQGLEARGQELLPLREELKIVRAQKA